MLGLVLVNPVSGNAEAARIAKVPEPDFRQEIEGWLRTLLDGASPQTREQVLASVQVARTPAMRAMLTDAASNDLPRSLAAYPGPVLILAAPDESMRRLSSASHWSTNDAPDEVNAALQEFLRPGRRRGRAAAALAVSPGRGNRPSKHAGPNARGANPLPIGVALTR